MHVFFGIYVSHVNSNTFGENTLFTQQYFNYQHLLCFDFIPTMLHLAIILTVNLSAKCIQKPNE